MRRARFVQGLGKSRVLRCQMHDRISWITQRCCASPDPVAINMLRHVSLHPGPKDLHVLLCPGTSTSRAGHRSCCLQGKWELPLASCLHWEHRRHLTWEEVWLSCESGVRISTLYPCSLSSSFTAPHLPCRTSAPASSGSSRTCSEHRALCGMAAKPAEV